MPPTLTRDRVAAWPDPDELDGDPHDVARATVKRLQTMTTLVRRAVLEAEATVRNARMQEALEQPRNLLIELANGQEVPAKDAPFEWWLQSADHDLTNRLGRLSSDLSRLTEALARKHNRE